MTDTVDEELEKALNSFQEAASDFHRRARSEPVSYHNDLFTARSRLTALFASRLDWWIDENAKDKAKIFDLREQLASRALTPEEARITLSRLTNDGGTGIPRAALWDAMEKLRRISNGN